MIFGIYVVLYGNHVPPSPPCPSHRSSDPSATDVRGLIFTSARRTKPKTRISCMLMNFSAHFDTNSNISPIHNIKVIVNWIVNYRRKFPKQDIHIC